jgi:hypothetical protein
VLALARRWSMAFDERTEISTCTMILVRLEAGKSHQSLGDTYSLRHDRSGGWRVQRCFSLPAVSHPWEVLHNLCMKAQNGHKPAQTELQKNL